MATLAIEDADELSVLESEVDGFRRDLQMLRQSIPGIVIDSDGWAVYRHFELIAPWDYDASSNRHPTSARIDAIRIMLDRPGKWSAAALTGLRIKLTAALERFMEELLQNAHLVRYHKALTDIVSMVKHAACGEEPRFTPEERVAKAFDRVTTAKQFTLEQRQWLDRMRAHLVKKISIQKVDFELSPVLTRAGFWASAD